MTEATRLSDDVQAALQTTAAEAWRAIVDAVPDPVAVIDRDGRILRANRAQVDLAGIDGSAAGWTLADLIRRMAARHGSESDLHGEPELAGVLSEGVGATGEVRLGSSIYLVRLAPLRTALRDVEPVRGVPGEVAAVVRMMTDITETRQAELDLREIVASRRSIFEASPLAILVLDPEGRVEGWSPAAERIFGWKAEEVVGRRHPAIPPERATELDDELARNMRGDGFAAFETWRQRRDGTRLEVSVWAAPLYDAVGRVRGGIHILADITDRRRTERSMAFLSEATRLLSGSLDEADSLTRLAELAVETFCDWCAVDVLRDDGGLARIGAAHRDPERAELLRDLERRYPAQSDGPGIRADVVRTGQPRLVTREEMAAALAGRDPGHLELLERLGISSGIWVPLVARGRLLGVASLGLIGPERNFDQADLATAEEMGRRAAVALDNSLLYRAERAARSQAELTAERMGRLQGLTSAFSRALTPAQVARAVVDQGTAALGAQAGFVMLVRTEDDTLELVRAKGYADELVSKYQRVALGADLPLAEAVRLGEPIFRTGREQIVAGAGASLGDLQPQTLAVAALPIAAGGRVLGVLGLSFSEPRIFDEDDRDYLAALSRLSAQALERARLFDAERLARSTAQRSSQRFARLQAATAAFSASLTPADVARLAVEHALADTDAEAGLLARRAEGDQLTLAHAMGFEPVTEAASASTTEQPGADLPIEVGWLTDPSAIAAVLAPFGLETRAGSKALATLPLTLDERVVGVIYLGFPETQPLSEGDRDFLAALGRLAAQALERARLYEAERAARAAAQEARRRLALLARAERSRAAELNAVIRAMGDAVLVCDAGGRIILANPAAHALFDDPAPADLDAVLARLRSADSSPVEETDLRSEPHVEARLLGDKERWLEIHLYPVQPGGRPEVDGSLVDEAAGQVPTEPDAPSTILVLRDVTALRRAKALREAFIGVLSHELRTPITTIYAGTKVLGRPLDRVPEETRREVFKDLEAESDRLYRLVEDLLVLSRVEAGTIEIGGEPVLLQHVLPEVVRNEAARWPATEFVTSIPAGLEAVLADRTYVEQVTRNLLANAAKYAPAGSTVELSTEQLGSEVRVTILDDGPGIAADEVERFFELFYRSPSTAAQAAGAGIGLFVTRQLVEAMGGHIWARPRPAGGAEFGFSLKVLEDDGL